MRAIQEISKTFHVNRFFDARLVLRIWTAVRAERIKFGRGREPFAEFVHDTITRALSECVFEQDDGALYEVPQGGLAPETIENFCNDLALQVRLNSTDQKIGFSRKTLQYLQAFCWSVLPERVAAWESSSDLEDVGFSSSLFGEYVDFGAPTDHLPPFGLILGFHASERTWTVPSGEGEYRPPAFDNKNVRERSVAAILCVPCEGSKSDSIYLINIDFLFDLSCEDISASRFESGKQVFDDHPWVVGGSALAFRHRKIQFKLSHDTQEPPEIDCSDVQVLWLQNSHSEKRFSRLKLMVDRAYFSDPANKSYLDMGLRCDFELHLCPGVISSSHEEVLELDYHSILQIVDERLFNKAMQACCLVAGSA